MVCITDSGETFEFSTSESFDENDYDSIKTHSFYYLVVDDIYELANIASIYCKYNDEYSICGPLKNSPFWGKRTLIDLMGSQYYNVNIKDNLPVKLLSFIEDTTKVFDNIKIDDDLIKSLKKKQIERNTNTLTFALLSKQILKEKTTFERCMSFIKNVDQQDYKNIDTMLRDIYKRNYKYNIIYVDISLKKSFSNFHFTLKQKLFEFITKSYDILALEIPTNLQKQFEIEELKPYNKFLHLSTNNSTTRSFNDNVCSICIEPFQEKCRIAELICKHKFHKQCIYQWLEHNLNCPCCREQFTKLS